MQREHEADEHECGTETVGHDSFLGDRGEADVDDATAKGGSDSCKAQHGNEAFVQELGTATVIGQACCKESDAQVTLIGCADHDPEGFLPLLDVFLCLALRLSTHPDS